MIISLRERNEMEISLCAKCNRVKINDQEWSEFPSKKITKDTKNVTVEDSCAYCLAVANIPAKPVDNKEDITQVDIVQEFKPNKVKDAPEEAHKNHSHIVVCKRLMGEALMDFADALNESKTNGYFKFYNESWEAYLSDADIGIDDSRARRLMLLSKSRAAMEKQLGRTVDFNEISEGRLCRELLHCIDYDKTTDTVKNIDDVEDLIDKARALGHEDFKAECDLYKSKKGDKNRDEPPEKRISEGPVNDAEGNVIGYISSCYANSRFHNLRIRIDNAHIPDDDLTIVIG